MQEPKTKYIERLFNPEFRNELPNLTLIAYCVSNNGHVCGYYQYKTRKVINVSHWMNDDDTMREENHKYIFTGVPTVTVTKV